MVAAAGEAPRAADAIAAFDRLRLERRARRSPGQNARRRAEDLARDLGFQIGSRHRAAVVLTDAPGDGRVGAGQRLGHLREDHGPQFGATEEARLQHAEEVAFDQRGDDPLGQFAALFDLVAGLFQQRRQVAGALDHVGVAHARASTARAQDAGDP